MQLLLLIPGVQQIKEIESKRTGFIKAETDKWNKIHEALQKAADAEIQLRQEVSQKVSELLTDEKDKINADKSISQIDVIEHDTTQDDYNSLALIDSSHLILAYSGVGSDGYIKSFSFDANFDNITEIDSLEYDTSESTYISLVRTNSIS